MARNIIQGLGLISLSILVLVLSLLNNHRSAAAPAIRLTTPEATPSVPLITMHEQALRLEAPAPVPSSEPTAEPVVLRLEAAGGPDPENGTVDLSNPLVGWPVTGEITQGFGCSAYFTGRPGPDCPAETPWFHDGVDIGPPAAGAPVRAALTGTVIFAGPDGSGPDCGQGYRGYGLAVVVGTQTGWLALYGHLDRVDVAAGQAVTPETVIGTVGETGCVSGPHLHFGLQHHNDLVDPEEMRR